jgi:uncharacterized membrane protein YhiD involved in acid resistance
MEMRIGWDVALACLLLAFVLCMVIAWVYTFTYQGLSYMRGFVQTIAVGGVISALVMLAIGDDIARGLGVVGALTIVRFRNTLKDSRDLLFVFTSLAVGVACGVQTFAIALVGTAVFSMAMIYVSFSSFGSRRQFDAVLRVQLPAGALESRTFNEVLKRHCRSFVLINLRELNGNAQEHVYHVRLLRPDSKSTLLGELGALPGLTGTTLLMQDTTVEM